jgi:hypothetical protein
MSDKLETWAVVDLFGHDKIAGHVTEISIAGKGFFRVDVPPMNVNGEEGYSKIFGPDAIYSILPVASEQVAIAACVSFAVRPLGTWTPSVLRALPAPTIDQDEDEDEELVCKTCGESFADLGDPICPFCGSDDTKPLD